MGKWWPLIKIVKPRSDEEFVEQLRRSARQFEVMTKLMVVYMSLILVAILGALGMALYMALKGRFGPNIAWSAIALMFGVMIGSAIHMCINLIMTFLVANRVRKLLIKYYDAIQELAASDEACLAPSDSKQL